MPRRTPSRERSALLSAREPARDLRPRAAEERRRARREERLGERRASRTLSRAHLRRRRDDLLSLAMIRFYLGDDDRGFEWLERAVAGRLSYVRWLNVHPALDPWRNDPRFVALVRRLRLPAA